MGSKGGLKRSQDEEREGMTATRRSREREREHQPPCSLTSFSGQGKRVPRSRERGKPVQQRMLSKSGSTRAVRRWKEYNQHKKSITSNFSLVCLVREKLQAGREENE